MELSDVSKTGIVEALIFASPVPMSVSKIAQAAGLSEDKEVAEIVQTLNEEYEKRGRAFRIKTIAGGFQFYTLNAYAPYLSEVFAERNKMRVSRAMLETLSIVALKQPVTKPVVDKIRGTDSSAPIHNLLEQGLITIRGRQKVPGRPFTYGTTDEFLKMFGLHRLEDLPNEDELSQMFGEPELAEKPAEKKAEENSGDAEKTTENINETTERSFEAKFELQEVPVENEKKETDAEAGGES